MIRFVGLGLSLEQLAIGAILRLLKCRKVYIDVYTNLWFPSIDELARVLKEHGIDVIMAYRKDLEGYSISKIVREASEFDVCIATAGDPMIATTHVAIAVEAARNGVELEIFPSTSILNAAMSLSCLQMYRFGKTVTVVKPKDGIVYEYPIHVIKINRSLGLHTLILLEVDIEKDYFMTPKDAITVLLYIQRLLGEEVLSEDDVVVILKAIGSPKCEIKIRTIKEVLKEYFDKTVYTLIIPAKKLHSIEEDCLRTIEKLKTYQTINVDTFRNIVKFMAI
ncbi:MAG: diphthine synthase [Ignisphaera sp.]|uniref:Diphthine synthase n=1 Tax=Ignisphaera aggregans TaxID=334771 RepID=A0A7J3N042_9CREN